MKLVLFDCDGTLVDSGDTIHQCMAQTFVDAGIASPTLDETRAIIGLSLDIAIARMLNCEVDASITALAQNYRQNFVTLRQSEGFNEPLYDGILPLLTTLSERDDVLLGVVTGKSQRGVRHVFHRHDIGDHFMIVKTADDCPSKPHPAMVLESCRETGMDVSSTIVIGDAIYDMQMAVSAGAVAAGVSWGYNSVPALRQAGAHHVLETPADLLWVLDKMDQINA